MKMKNNIIIGIDTSCYTTSIAAITFDGDIILNEKIMLKVKKDSKGLRQSEAVFQHVNNFGYISDKLNKILEEYNVAAVCASSRPRPIENSYMPVFTVGQNFAKLYSSLSQSRYYETSHQENHIESVLFNSNIKNKNRFLSVHISGGTTEILLSEKPIEDFINCDYNIEIVGGSRDVSFGQLIDRLGVGFDYEFPCGKYIDENALKSNLNIEQGLKTSVKEGYMNLSGIENQINKFVKDNYNDIDNVDKNYVSKLLMDTLSRCLYKSLIFLCKKYKVEEVLFAGGVSASKYLSQSVTEKLSKNNIKAYFSEPKYSTDNAVGCAIIGLNKFLGE